MPKIRGTKKNDFVHTAENGHLAPKGANKILKVTAVSDLINAKLGNDTVYGMSGNDNIFGGVSIGLATKDKDRLFGGLGDDKLYGGIGNDLLDGGEGRDTLNGGKGDDTYVVDHVRDRLSERSNEGIDTVKAFINYRLTLNVENLTLAGSAAEGTGNSSGNKITGNGVSNVLSGLDGQDTLNGQAGDDTLYGGNGSDSLIGDVGNDVLDGGAGTDTMVGGLGNDTYVVDSESDVVTEASDAGIDTVQTTLSSYTLGDNFEALTYTGSGNFTGTGNDGNNTLEGGSGADTLFGGAGSDELNGGAGADSLVGGTGHDIYHVDDLNDVIVENAGEGSDMVQTSLGSWTLGANIENLTKLGSSDFTGTGNALANILTGNSGSDTLDGAAGVDTLIGGAGADHFVLRDVDSHDVINDFVAGTDVLEFDVQTLAIGNSDGTLDNVNTINSNSEAWSSSNEILFANGLVATEALFVADFLGTGNNSTEVAGQRHLIVASSNNSTKIYLHVADGTTGIDVDDLILLADLGSANGLSASDFVFFL